MSSGSRKKAADHYFSQALHTMRFFVPYFLYPFVSLSQTKISVRLQAQSFPTFRAHACAATHDCASNKQRTQ